MGYNHLFMDKSVTFSRREDSSAFMGRLKGMLYLVDFNKSKTKLETCLVAKLIWVGYGVEVVVVDAPDREGSATKQGTA
jgi:hypothetical protein